MQNNTICNSVYGSWNINNNTKSCVDTVALTNFTTCWTDAGDNCTDKKNCCNQYSTPSDSQECLKFGRVMYPQGCVDENSCYEEIYKPGEGYTLTIKDSCILPYGI